MMAYIFVLTFLLLSLRNYQVDGIAMIVPMFGEPVPLRNAILNNKNVIALEDLTNVTSKLTLITIVKPNGGPAGLTLPWMKVIEAFRTASPQTPKVNSYTLGYVNTNLGTRSFGDVQQDIDKYYSWPPRYRPNGIFFDNVPTNTTGASKLSYYQELYSYVKKKFEKVFTNHLKVFSGQFLCSPDLIVESGNPCRGGRRATDVAIAFEGSFDEWKNYDITNNNSLNANQLGAFVTSARSLSDVFNAFRLANSRRVGYVFVTGGSSIAVQFMTKEFFDFLVSLF